jgi:hypothetical protein
MIKTAPLLVRRRNMLATADASSTGVDGFEADGQWTRMPLMSSVQPR